MFFIKSALKALETPGKPFLHDVITAAGLCTNVRGPGRKPVRLRSRPLQPCCAG
jgi:hypothetical protein